MNNMDTKIKMPNDMRNKINEDFKQMLICFQKNEDISILKTIEDTMDVILQDELKKYSHNNEICLKIRNLGELNEFYTCDSKYCYYLNNDKIKKYYDIPQFKKVLTNTEWYEFVLSNIISKCISNELTLLEFYDCFTNNIVEQIDNDIKLINENTKKQIQLFYDHMELLAPSDYYDDAMVMVKIGICGIE